MLLLSDSSSKELLADASLSFSSLDFLLAASSSAFDVCCVMML